MGAIVTMPVDETIGSGRKRSWRRAFGLRLLALVESLEKFAARRRSRIALLALTDEQLKDIGISRADAHREGIRSFWE